MTTLNAEQNIYLNQLISQPPADWPESLQKTAVEACRQVQEAPYVMIRGIIAAWILDGQDRFMTLSEMGALQPDVDVRQLIA